jgi:hypothetical protein
MPVWPRWSQKRRWLPAARENASRVARQQPADRLQSPSKEVFLDRDTKTPVLPPRCGAARAAGQLTISGASLISLSGVSMHHRPHVPVLPVLLMIVEFETLNDMITEAEAHLGVGLEVARI